MLRTRKRQRPEQPVRERVDYQITETYVCHGCGNRFTATTRTPLEPEDQYCGKCRGKPDGLMIPRKETVEL